jgi:plastocyanin
VNRLLLAVLVAVSVCAVPVGCGGGDDNGNVNPVGGGTTGPTAAGPTTQGSQRKGSKHGRKRTSRSKKNRGKTSAPSSRGTTTTRTNTTRTTTTPPPKAPKLKQTSNYITVSERDFNLTPANPKVKPGTITIKILNLGTFPHALNVEGPEGVTKAKLQLPQHSETLQVKLDKPGKYEWYCPVANYRKLGMEGKIVVTGGA